MGHWLMRHWTIVIVVFGGLAALALLILRIFYFQPFTIRSAAMSPTINPGDAIIVYKTSFQDAPPRYGEVIVFRHAGTSFVKRIVGLPGDRVQMVHGVLQINGAAALQRRIEDWEEACEEGTCRVRQYEETLPSGRHLRILDRDPDGPADDTAIYRVPAGHYFVLGDNRDNSDDSRLEIGYVAAADLIGKVTHKYLADGEAVWEPVE